MRYDNCFNSSSITSGVRRKLLALDVDGTLLTEDGRITAASLEAVSQAQKAGITVIIASGRDYDAIPWDQFSDIEIPYVVTTNGSAVYRTADRKCLYEECIQSREAEEIFRYLLTKHIYMEFFVDGTSYTPEKISEIVYELPLPEHIKNMIIKKQKLISDVPAFLRKGVKIQKGTLNFVKLQDGRFLDREETRKYLEARGDLTIVDGGYSNLEFTKAGIDKSIGLRYVAELLAVPMEETVAVGDSENDIEMLKAAGLGIAMGNALPKVKKAADAVTCSNEEEGVAAAIRVLLGTDR